MNYKRRKPAYRRIRHAHGYIGLGKDQIRQQIDKDYFDKAVESVNNYHFHKKIL
jgi:hypothetical protein